jgi:hypothetical protein
MKTDNKEILSIIDRLADMLFPCSCRDCVIARGVRLLNDMDAQYAKRKPVIQ